MYDCIIIGMGPAGMSCGIYANRANLKTLIIEEKCPGGYLNSIDKINNYLGFNNISGSELAFNMFEHVKSLKIDYTIAKTLKIKNEKDYKIVYTSKGEYKSKTVVISTGRKLKRTKIKNEDKYLNKGISYCAICDGALYKNKKIVLLSNEENDNEYNYLSNLTNSIKLFKLNEVIEFIGDDKLTHIKLKNNETVECDAVFISSNAVIDNSFLSELDILDEKGYVIVDGKMKTKIDGIYAIGDVIRKDLYQVCTAVSDGAIAATSIKKDYLK